MLDFDALVLAPTHATFGEANRGNPIPTYKAPGGSTAVPIDGVFRIETLDEFRGPEIPGMTSRNPELDLRASQVPSGVSIVQGGTVAVRGVTYLVADVRPDGNGLITLRLAE